MQQPGPESPPFSLVEGGPLYRLLSRLGLVGSAMSRLPRRILALTLIAWIPPLILSAMNGRLFSGHLPFSADIETHARLLLAIPILLAAEAATHGELRWVLSNFMERGLVAEKDFPRFQDAIGRAFRLRDSLLAELALLVFVWTAGHYIWRTAIVSDRDTWYATPDATGGLDLTTAGFWFGFVSIPIFQFVLLRWYYRIFIWYQLLWRISRLPLQLQPTHPDRTGGLGFINFALLAFSPIVLAQGVTVAGLAATRILSQGHTLLEFREDILGLVLFILLVLLAPLLMFLPLLRAAKTRGMMAYGALASHYSTAFDRKWLGSTLPPGEPLLGTADIQSLADLGNAYDNVSGMRLVPFRLDVVIGLFLTAVIPILPLFLTLVPLRTIIDWVFSRLL